MILFWGKPFATFFWASEVTELFNPAEKAKQLFYPGDMVEVENSEPSFIVWFFCVWQGEEITLTTELVC